MIYTLYEILAILYISAIGYIITVVITIQAQKILAAQNRKDLSPSSTMDH